MDIENYSKIAPQYYDATISCLLVKYLETEKFMNLLDCGCGDGSLLYSMNKFRYLDKKNVIAIDLSKNRIELVKKINTNISAKIDSAEELKTIEDNSIDFFISTQVIEHVDDKKMIKQIEKKVKKGGIIYISTVFKKWYGWYFYRNQLGWVLDPTHLREYTQDKQLLDLLNNNEFKLLENKKNIQWFSVLDFFIKRMGVKNRYFYENKLMKICRKIKIPILGYYNWEIVFKKL
jgi:2-polyprenyl-3-methyl-5-hydroxy-6-metoxy-1,4-benzoquinol methylase